MNQVTLEKTPEYLVIKIPLKAVETGKAPLKSGSKQIIDEAIAEGLADIKAGRVFGPFDSVKKFNELFSTRPAKLAKLEQ